MLRVPHVPVQFLLLERFMWICCVNRASMQMGLETPDVLAINCTNLANTSEIFGKVLSASQL